jgi:hypothetical protein
MVQASLFEQHPDLVERWANSRDRSSAPIPRTDLVAFLSLLTWPVFIGR